MTRGERVRELYGSEGALGVAGRALRFVGDRLRARAKVGHKRRVRDRFADSPRYLNVGGGDFVREHWRVLDHPTDWYDYADVFVDVPVDLERAGRWPVETDAFDIVYTSHTLEHLTDAAVEHTLSEARRVLAPGGTLRVNVPDSGLAFDRYERGDLAWFTDAWLEGYTDDVYYADGKVPSGYELEFYLLSFFATYLARVRHGATDFAQVRADADALSRREFLQTYSDRVRDDWHEAYPGWHRNWFTPDRLAALIADAGFVDVQESACRQSRETELCTAAFDQRPHISTFVEARAPE